ncbi:MAG: hypothetical protein LUH00_08075, partial [Lachnospiraceae bacterium]|nr:hypothetical protein [Lachnospiraceae bacterium]
KLSISIRLYFYFTVNSNLNIIYAHKEETYTGRTGTEKIKLRYRRRKIRLVKFEGKYILAISPLFRYHPEGWHVSEELSQNNMFRLRRIMCEAQAIKT